MPSAFTGPIRLEHLDADWRMWRLLDPLTWEADELGSGQNIVVPADFRTDGASVPRALWWIFPMTGKYLRAACLHDYLYVQIENGTPNSYAPTKWKADRQFRIAMKACGVSRPVRVVMWLAVSLFGDP